MAEIVLVAAVVVVLIVAFVTLSRRNGAAALVNNMTDGEMEDGIVSEPVPVAATAAYVSRWSQQFDSPTGPLDASARLRLINDLGMLRAAWCVPLLERAYEEERDEEIRAAAERALAKCRDGTLSRS